jgi:hypothetical protein
MMFHLQLADAAVMWVAGRQWNSVLCRYVSQASLRYQEERLVSTHIDKSDVTCRTQTYLPRLTIQY